MQELDNIMIVIGTRPEIIKMAPIIRELINKKIDFTIVHTGQHYDYNMSEVFFKVLKIPQPNVYLNVGSGSPAYQLGTICQKLEKVVVEVKPKIVLAQGDTNSVAAVGLVCSKTGFPFGHVEAGIRSFDMTMPEEINRKIAAITASLHFAPSKRAVVNLMFEGINPERIFLTGNTIVDATLDHIKIAEHVENEDLSKILEFVGKNNFILTTIHRQSNVDSPVVLKELVNAFKELSNRDVKIVFPIHPRTLKNIKRWGFLDDFKNIENLYLCNPLDYLSFLKLMNKAKLILTDSGGIQEEAITLKKKIVTVRYNTERPETLECGINVLSKPRCEDILEKIEMQLNDNFVIDNIINPYGNGNAAKNIVKILREHKELYSFQKPDFTQKGYLIQRAIQLRKKTTVSNFEKGQRKIQMIFNEKGEPTTIGEYLKENEIIIYLGSKYSE